jgi:hypothetical protein
MDTGAGEDLRWGVFVELASELVESLCAGVQDMYKCLYMCTMMTPHEARFGLSMSFRGMQG